MELNIGMFGIVLSKFCLHVFRFEQTIRFRFR